MRSKNITGNEAVLEEVHKVIDVVEISKKARRIRNSKRFWAKVSRLVPLPGKTKISLNIPVCKSHFYSPHPQN